MASGGGLKQIIALPAGVPGANNSVYSALQTVTVTTNANTVITDIGEILVMPNPASVSVELQTAAGVWTTLMPAGGTSAQQYFSDATNLRFHSADTSTTRSGTYYVIQ